MITNLFYYIMRLLGIRWKCSYNYHYIFLVYITIFFVIWMVELQACNKATKTVEPNEALSKAPVMFEALDVNSYGILH